MSLASLPDLPWEILSAIMEILGELLEATRVSRFRAPYTASRDLHIPIRDHYVTLSQVCRKLHDRLSPILWRNIAVKELRALRNLRQALKVNTARAESVDTFKFVLFPYILSMIKENEPSTVVVNLIQDILHCLPNLRSLIMYRSPNRASGIIEWPFDLGGNKKLEILHVYTYRLSPYQLGQIFETKSLRHLLLCDAICEEEWAWASTASPIKTNVLDLSLYNDWWGLWVPPESEQSKFIRHGYSNSVIQGLLSCFEALECLSLEIRSDVSSRLELPKILMTSGINATLQSLNLQARDTPADMFGGSQLQIQFVSWANLKKLEIDAHILWPLRKSWKLRKRLYRILPPSLVSLIIHFPRRLGLSNHYDGAFRMNKSFSIYEDDFGIPEFGKRPIPPKRYEWVLNLLRQRLDPDNGQGEYYFPKLRSIHLMEDISVGEGRGHTYSLSTAPFILPADIAAQFQARDVTIKFDAIVYQRPDVDTGIGYQHSNPSIPSDDNDNDDDDEEEEEEEGDYDEN